MFDRTLLETAAMISVVTVNLQTILLNQTKIQTVSAKVRSETNKPPVK